MMDIIKSEQKTQNRSHQFLVFFLLIYFSSKMLWDMIPFRIIEFFSIGCIAYGTGIMILNFRKITLREFVFLTIYIFFVLYIIIQALLMHKDLLYLTRGIYEYIFYSIILFATIYFVDNLDMQKILSYVGLFGIVLSLLSIYEYVSRKYIINKTLMVLLMFRSSVFSRSYLSHGVILGIMFLINLYIFLKIKKQYYIVFTIICFLGLLTTLSRGPMVATFVAGLFLYACFRRLENKKISYNSIILGLLGIGVIVILVFTVFNENFNVSNTMVNYILKRIRSITDWQGDPGNLGRTSIWNSWFSILQKNWLFGIGVSSTGSWGAQVTVTESGMLKRLVETGIVGFSMYYTLIIIILGRLWNKCKMMGLEKKEESLLFFCILLLILIDDITLQVTEEIMVAFFLWFSLGILCHNAEFLKFRNARL